MQLTRARAKLIITQARRSMRLTRDSIIAWGCVSRITFPNEKINAGSDTARNAKQDFFKYFGSPAKAKSEMLEDLGNYLLGNEAYVLKKEILHSGENVRVGDILQIEQKYIKSLNAKDTKVGCNR